MSCCALMGPFSHGVVNFDKSGLHIDDPVPESWHGTARSDWAIPDSLKGPSSSGKDLDPVLGPVQLRVPVLVTSSSSAQPAMVPVFLTTLRRIVWLCVCPHLVDRRRSSDLICWSDSFPLSEACPSDTPRCALTDLCLHVTKIEGNYRLDWREGWIIFHLGFMLCEVKCGSGSSFDFKS